MKNVKTKYLAYVSVALLIAGVGVANAATEPVDQKTQTAAQRAEAAKQRQEILAMRDATLKRLYKAKPAVRNEIAKAEGYAVFNANQANVVLLVAGSGAGVLVDNLTGQPTFMKIHRLGTGPGLGFKKYKQVLVFKSRKVLETFKTVGADVNASGDATVKLTEHGDGKVLDTAVSLDPMISVYQLTDRGVLLQANWGGMAYLPDSSLNTSAAEVK